MFAVTLCINSETKKYGYPGRDNYKKTQCPTRIILSIILNSEIRKSQIQEAVSQIKWIQSVSLLKPHTSY